MPVAALNKRSRPRRPAVRLWIGFGILLAVFVSAELAVNVAGSRADQLEGEYRARSAELRRALGRYRSYDVDRIERDLNDGNPLPHQEVNELAGRATRLWVEGFRVGPQFRGWTARIDFGSGWTNVRVFPPERRPPGPWLASPSIRGAAAVLRNLVLLMGATVCWGGLWIIPLAPKARRGLGKVCAAAAAVVLIAWLLEPSRPAPWRSGALTVVPIAALFALALSACAALIPYKRPIAVGRCLECGYNLTGNISGKCPECGTPVPLGVSALSSPTGRAIGVRE